MDPVYQRIKDYLQPDQVISLVYHPSRYGVSGGLNRPCYLFGDIDRALNWLEDELMKVILLVPASIPSTMSELFSINFWKYCSRLTKR